MSRTFKILAVAATILMYIVMLQGSLVTNSGSADGCGASFPLCHDRVIPSFAQIETVIEFSHRAITGLAGILVFWLAIWSWRAFPENRVVRWMAPTAIFFLVLQSGLGAAAVLWPQPSLVKAAHFGISLVSFASVLLLAMVVLGRDGVTYGNLVSERLRRWNWLTISYVLIVVYSGAYVRHTGSDLACLGWPTCNGTLWPTLYGPVGIHFAHRLLAAGTLLVIGRLAWLAYQERAARPDVYVVALLAFGLVMLQAISGGLVVLSLLELMYTMLHSAIISALFGVLSYLCLLVTPPGGVPFSRRTASSGAN